MEIWRLKVLLLMGSQTKIRTMLLETGRMVILVIKWQKGPELGNHLVPPPDLTTERIRIREREEGTKIY